MIDLHCHTKISDCSFTTEEVISMAEQKGVTHLAITNHDTTSGLSEAAEIGMALGVSIIPGIEISAFDFTRGNRAHILGLYVTPGHEAISELCQPLIEQRNKASQMMVRILIEAGYDLSWDEVEELAAGGTGVYKQHIMHALLKKGYTNSIYGTLYKKLFSKGRNEKERGMAYIPIEYVSAEDAIKAIRRAGGIPVLAHPGQFHNFDAVEEWVQLGLEGIEVNHPLHNQTDRIKAGHLAERFNLIQTGGSDFHGFYSDTQSEIGAFAADQVEFDKLIARRESMLKL
ncbi:PHP domain-containing protein [Metabacillus dongyingensis]|uniref:PHP domain-containing protein n=1 Tax=Metabacillus dongyingensis TaxID=2874282 RepID=UPI001CBC6031|nr:PHP domain-containing protein [Metabacillus dongyingensis]UAL53671.1 PHP domain-containing protein [Metabacillus dongyingensis]